MTMMHVWRVSSVRGVGCNAGRAGGAAFRFATRFAFAAR
jgi:hypothetical protein